ncbi:uncharacterized protein LOC141608041 isoform X2 [Silene latifolia]|uniref:uncharacterized protein LOC141608041 isoform X2 n=1 Tax=Silene latifolia TaxID=37657 RepID=UPI003D77D10D
MYNLTEKLMRGQRYNPKTAGDGSNSGSHVSVEAEEARNLGAVTENAVTDSQIPEERGLESYSIPAQDQSQNSSSTINLEEYNILYKQYYEIEEQRQKILQQMQHFNNEYYPYSGEASTAGVQCGTIHATQEYQGTSHMPCGAMVVSCCPCACQCSVASCSSLPFPSAGTCGAGPPSTKGLEVNPAVDNVDFVAEALGAAQRALSTLTDKTSDSAKENKLCNAMEENGDSETNLSEVLNAWYSAGFYTGKYLTEKSIAKKRHD